MANLVFKGHATRGKELHKLLENLGGIDAGYVQCSCVTCYYYINREGYIEGSNAIHLYMDKRLIMTLEEFEKKYPYKVGDNVNIPEYESEVRINSMRWNGYNILYEVVTDESEWYSTEELNDFNEPRKQEAMKKEISGAIVDRFICLEGYDFYDDKGNIIDTKEITMKKKQPKYPKTYEECCKVLGHVIIDEVRGYKELLLDNLQMLLICRDAYWKIVEKWKPEYKEGVNNNYYTIHTFNNKITLAATSHRNAILAFPTEEMRQTFYVNFKNLIEECKELL